MLLITSSLQSRLRNSHREVHTSHPEGDLACAFIVATCMLVDSQTYQIPTQVALYMHFNSSYPGVYASRASERPPVGYNTIKLETNRGWCLGVVVDVEGASRRSVMSRLPPDRQRVIGALLAALRRLLRRPHHIPYLERRIFQNFQAEGFRLKIAYLWNL